MGAVEYLFWFRHRSYLFFFKYPSAAVVADLWFAEERTHVTKNNGSAALKKIFGLVDRES